MWALNWIQIKPRRWSGFLKCIWIKAVHAVSSGYKSAEKNTNCYSGSHSYLCPPCLLKAHASATTWPVALLTTGTQSMEEISQPSRLDSCLRSSWEHKKNRRKINPISPFILEMSISETLSLAWSKLYSLPCSSSSFHWRQFPEIFKKSFQPNLM